MSTDADWTTTWGTSSGQPVILDSVQINTGSQYWTNEQFLFGGTGPVIYTGSITFGADLHLPLPSSAAVSNYNWDISAGALTNFTAGGSPVPVYDATGGPSSGPAVTFNAASPATTATSSLTFTIPGRPGKYLYMFSHWSITSAIPTNGWQITVKALDQAGDVISTLSNATYGTSGETTPWAYVFGGSGSLLPAGTENVQISIFINDTTGSAALDRFAAYAG